MQNKIESAVKTIAEFIETAEPLTNRNLVEICRRNKIELVGKKNESHHIHELLETAINLHIASLFNGAYLHEKANKKQTLARLAKLLEICPTQSWRGTEQIQLQQFSTPPTIAYLMAKILNPSMEELVLEPSAGTGALATWLKIFRCRVHVNELSETRRMLLELQGFKPTGFDAEFIDDLLPDEIKPEAVMMNPPFSSSGGKTRINDSNYGLRHVRSALLRLKTGGRLVALLGTESATKTDKARRFWNETSAEYDLRAIIHLPNNAFYKYGTSIRTRIFCIGKNVPQESRGYGEKRKSVLEVRCHTLEECLKYVDVFN